MKFESPILKRSIKANKERLPEILKGIQKTEDPFLIVSESEMVYMQVFWTTRGYIIEYQEGSIKKHYETVKKISLTETRKTLEEYMDGGTSWKKRLEFVKMKIE